MANAPRPATSLAFTTPSGGLPRPASPELLLRSSLRWWQARPGHFAAGAMPAGRQPTAMIGERIRAVYGDRRWPQQPLWLCALRLATGRRVVFGRDLAPNTARRNGGRGLVGHPRLLHAGRDRRRALRRRRRPLPDQRRPAGRARLRHHRRRVADVDERRGARGTVPGRSLVVASPAPDREVAAPAARRRAGGGHRAATDDLEAMGQTVDGARRHPDAGGHPAGAALGRLPPGRPATAGLTRHPLGLTPAAAGSHPGPPLV